MAKELLFSVSIEDCEVQTFRSGGKGGQNQNKRDTGVRVIHHPSGARGECREERSQLQNKRRAFRKMAESSEFRQWVRIQSGRIKSDEEYLKETMKPENLKTEVRGPGGWVEVEEEELLDISVDGVV